MDALLVVILLKTAECRVFLARLLDMQAFSNLLKKPNKLLKLSTFSRLVAYFSITFGLQMFAIILLRSLFGFPCLGYFAYGNKASLFFNLKLNLAESSFDLCTNEIHNSYLCTVLL